MTERVSKDFFVPSHNWRLNRKLFLNFYQNNNIILKQWCINGNLCNLARAKHLTVIYYLNFVNIN